MSEETASPAAAAPGGEKKKKRVIVTPPCPPSVATGYLILRGALLGLLGCNVEETDAALLQPTYIKEKIPSAKFATVLGKKQGNGVIQLPTTTTSAADKDQQQAALWTALQTAVNRIVQEGLDINCCQMTKEEAVAKYGNHILNGAMKKVKDADTVTVASVQGLVQCVPPTVPFASTSNIATITIDVAQSNIVATPKKAEVVIKFKVDEQLPGESPPGLAATTGDFDADAALTEKTIRLPEGQALHVAQQKQQAEAAEQEAKKAKDEAESAATAKEDKSNEMVVNAWEVSGKIDYDKLVDKFGSKIIEEKLLKQLEEQTVGKGRVSHMHRFLRRNIFFSHRDLAPLLECIEQQKGGDGVVPMYLYTGRGPSSAAMHLGHLVPFLFTQWLQEAFDCPLVIQMTDDEKFLFKGEYNEETGDNLNHFRDLTIENARDIIACGFNPKKTFLFSDLDYVGTMYPNIVRIWKAVTTNSVNGIFGFDGTSNIGKIAFPAIQAAPAFSTSFPTVLQGCSPQMACLIPCAIDQDPYFRMTRDVAHKLTPNHKEHKLGGKPALIHSKFFPPLQGAEGKMSSSDTNSAIFLTDTPEEIERKIKQHAFSGGRETKVLQQEFGADLETDVSYQWLRFFLEDDDELEAIGASYSSGQGDYWSTGLVKNKLISVLQELVAAHQARRATITDEQVHEWMKQRCIL